MNDFQKTVLKRLDDLEKTVEQLKSENLQANKALEFERLPENATVGKDYVAYRFKCSEEAVVRGRAGTHCLRPKLVCEKPLKWIKRDVDAAWRERSKPKQEKAAEAIAEAKPVRRKSIIPKPALKAA